MKRAISQSFRIVAQILFIAGLGCSLVANGFASDAMGLHTVSIPIPIGAYTHSETEYQLNGIGVGNHNQKILLNGINRYLARYIWFAKEGFLEYHLPNPLPYQSKIQMLRLFFEVSSAAPCRTAHQQSDISIYINGIKIGTHSVQATCPDRRGKYTPVWWPKDSIQYGNPILIEIRAEGSYLLADYDSLHLNLKGQNLSFDKISSVGLKALDLHQGQISFQIGVDKGAQHRNGMRLFGENFGDYAQPILLMLEYEGEKIYQPKIADIIHDPAKYENKTVIMAVHPGGWSCPALKSTPIPEGFSRSATMVYDSTGCLYGRGDVLVGKILCPETHPLNRPGKETIVIKAKIRRDNNNTPFLVPFSDDAK